MEHGRPAVARKSACCELDLPLTHPRPLPLARLGSLLLLYFGLSLAAHAGEAWLPVSPEELQMKSEPKDMPPQNWMKYRVDFLYEHDDADTRLDVPAYWNRIAKNEYQRLVKGFAQNDSAFAPLGLFGAGERHRLESPARVHPIYFKFPYQHTDDIAIELPPSWQASNVPAVRTTDIKLARFSSSAQASGSTITLKRDLTLNTILVSPKNYDQVRGFYQAVRTGDDEQVVITH